MKELIAALLPLYDPMTPENQNKAALGEWNVAENYDSLLTDLRKLLALPDPPTKVFASLQKHSEGIRVAIEAATGPVGLIVVNRDITERGANSVEKVTSEGSICRTGQDFAETVQDRLASEIQNGQVEVNDLVEMLK